MCYIQESEFLYGFLILSINQSYFELDSDSDRKRGSIHFLHF